MSKTQMNLQDSFLNQARRENILVTVHLSDGSQLKGRVKGFDNFIIILGNEDGQQMVYKHSVSSIVPEKPISTIFNHPPRPNSK
jgi:host factor-I protein